jgi:hypothetical protein
LGPVSTVVDALETLRVQPVSDAILQDFLSDGSASPVARWLVEHDVTFVISANSDLRAELQHYRSSMRICSGSAPVFLLIRELEEEMVNHRERKGELGPHVARA